MSTLPTISLKNASDAQINAAVAEYCVGYIWIATGYDTDKPPCPRWLELVHPDKIPLGMVCGWQYFPHLKCPEPCNRRHNFVPDYLHSADAVIELLEKQSQYEITYEFKCCHAVKIWTWGPNGFFAQDNSFCRAACIALLRASGVEVTE